jgi:redox-sensitive bicupin YhaK (pirin superfamily)
VLSGALEHKDSMGNGRIIQPGEVQYMAAGTGVRHSEFNPSKDEAVHFLQIWILPDRQGLKPRYAERSLAKAPKGRFNLVVSKAGREGSLAINQDADLYVARLETGNEASHTLKPARFGWVHVAEGEVKLNGDTLKAGDAAAFAEEPQVQLVAAKPSQVLLFDLN